MNLPSVFKKIREKISGLGEKQKKSSRGAGGYFGEMQNVREKWDLSEKDAYVKQHGRRRVPRFVIPVAIFLLIVVMLFWALPGLVSRFTKNTGAAPDSTMPPRTDLWALRGTISFCPGCTLARTIAMFPLEVPLSSG